ncbi:hypothetical protein DFH06DRAFT_344163 [Mycena polygramma]|nr:hypothetical protein DFH06DRAFT_344163 [Mycena polygramma]
MWHWDSSPHALSSKRVVVMGHSKARERICSTRCRYFDSLRGVAYEESLRLNGASKRAPMWWTSESVPVLQFLDPLPLRRNYFSSEFTVHSRLFGFLRQCKPLDFQSSPVRKVFSFIVTPITLDCSSAADSARYGLPPFHRYLAITLLRAGLQHSERAKLGSASRWERARTEIHRICCGSTVRRYFLRVISLVWGGPTQALAVYICACCGLERITHAVFEAIHRRCLELAPWPHSPKSSSTQSFMRWTTINR